MSDDGCHIRKCGVGKKAQVDLKSDGKIDDEKRERLDQVLNLLVISRRRDILYYLRRNTTCNLEELATHLELSRTTDFADLVTTEEVSKRIKITLKHKDLPVLADADLIEFDHRSGDIRYTDSSRLLEAALTYCSMIEQDSDSQSQTEFDSK